jgi:hypothetical protein
MPPINQAAITAGVIAVSVVVAAGIAIYESPELRRMAEDLRRRIAIALHSLGDSISPQQREDLLNRPEDAEGFLQSRGINIREETGVDADEETRRRQREELMFWNAVAESKREQEMRDSVANSVENEKTLPMLRDSVSRGSSFDDFLKQDSSAEKGTFVFNSGADVRAEETDGLRRRGDGARGLNYSVLTNPFADEHGIDENVAFENSLIEPERDEMDTDIYSVSHDGRDNRERETTATLSAPPEHIPTLVEVASPTEEVHPTLPPTLERELGNDEFMTAGQDDRNDAYSSIQAWAQTSNPGFYSPIPVSPAGPLSEVSDGELISEGQLTPTDSASLAGSGEDIGDDVRSTTSANHGRYYDVVSDDGMMTPASWTEVGSVVSESDAGAQPTRA